MKKKKIIKKLLSVVLSAATVFSLLTLPAHAIIPGEDAYDYVGIVQYDCASGVSIPLDIEQNYMFSYEEQPIGENNEILPQGIIGTDDRVAVDPRTTPFSGIVLIIQLLDTDGDDQVDNFSSGTGFMVTEDIMMTALHCIYPNPPDEEDCIIDTIIYHGVTIDIEEELGRAPDDSSGTRMEILNLLENNYRGYHIQNAWFDTTFYVDEETKYDWCLARLETELNGYSFPISSSITRGMIIEVTGYPAEPADKMFGMYKKSGTVVDVASTGEVHHNMDTTTGQSGSPIYSPATLGGSAPYTVCAIHSRKNNSTTNAACPITSTIIALLNSIS